MRFYAIIESQFKAVQFEVQFVPLDSRLATQTSLRMRRSHVFLAVLLSSLAIWIGAFQANPVTAPWRIVVLWVSLLPPECCAKHASMAFSQSSRVIVASMTIWHA